MPTSTHTPICNPKLYIGLMSGTSIDAVDAVLIEITDHIKIIADHSKVIPQSLKDTILALCTQGQDEINRAFQLDRELGYLFADCTLALCSKANISPEKVSAIGSHGQTIRHQPQGKHPFTLQIADPNTIAETTGITTVADFRRRDVAAGGQGAPLVPAFHEDVFKSNQKNRAIINIGGMANITLIDKSGVSSLGFDTGPGNVLLDYWIYKHKHQKFDQSGQWASSGTADPILLERLLSEPYLEQCPPKSTGRELFNADWLEQHLLQSHEIPAMDVQATLVALTCKTIADAIAMCDARLQSGNKLESSNKVEEIYICGGGAHNTYMLACLQSLLPSRKVSTTKALGIDPGLVESVAFAWLAHRTLNKLTGNLTSATGAREERVLGAVYSGN